MSEYNRLKLQYNALKLQAGLPLAEALSRAEIAEAKCAEWKEKAIRAWEFMSEDWKRNPSSDPDSVSARIAFLASTLSGEK